MGYENIGTTTEGAVALVEVRRPDKLNALNDATLGELTDAFLDLQADESVQAVILTGGEAKKPAFVAGADIAELADQDPMLAKERAHLGQGLCQVIEDMEKPVIAAINGFALGGGLELALACHFRYAAEGARMGLPEVTLGIIPGFGGTQRLPRAVGFGMALELITTGRMIDAAEALRIGLVNHVYPDAELLEQARKTAGAIAKNGPIAVRLAMEAARRGRSLAIEDAMAYEANLFGLISATDDMREGLTAFSREAKSEVRELLMAGPAESWFAHNEHCQEIRRRWPSIWKLPRVARATRHAASHIETGQTVLDIGASAGRFGRKLPMDTRYLAMDIDPEVQADIRDLSEVEDATIDVAVCFETIEHLALDEARALAAHTARVLRPNGLLFVSTPNTFHPTEYLRSATHITPFSYEELGALFLEAGLTVDAMWRCHHDSFLKACGRTLAFPLYRTLGVDFARSILVKCTRRDS